MMEHLARAAMELHHQRTGRKIQSDHPSVAWTKQEKDVCVDLHKKGVSVDKICEKLENRTETQVKVFLRNVEERQRALAQQMEETTPRKHKGRGRKPPTQATNTVPHAKLNVKYLLSGKALT
eukprot:CAMPEP_0116830426 /NCGR_PEP_ID=MMETSP0418-20121206/4756_1 /TAXON_ID=1158023 /ORGANISM="Astrosyne radiata, Strain 13vi08-1A" /LENGTH=121 /DNA_ID=CAMNT_0004459527 /DNA_START=134 /DNA_END=499 /DNA_ORIENTATION=-